MNEVIKNILERRSCRIFKEEKIEKELLKEIVKAGAFAPSAMNQQPWHFTVISNKDLLDQLSFDAKEIVKTHDLEYLRNYANNEKFHIFYNAPTIILVSHKEDAYEPKVDCAAATENILLAAQSLGIGSCWVEFVSCLFEKETPIAKKYMEKLGIPNGYKAIHAVALGYSKLETIPTPKHKENTINFVD
ncbi:nitroreductase family protein [Cetobacterium sp.]|uniref:nitroreductase family protein n=1 Tax=Cetobacterium sp. TaxID=2071632 RepID=UPI003F3CCB97